MSALIPNGSLISIGGALLRTIGLMPQRISSSSEARFPAHPIAAGLAYQKTGMGEYSKTIEAETYPHVTGGLDAFDILLAHHRMQTIVPFIRLRGNYLAQSDGLCGIATLEWDEERFHPFDGVGRKIEVTVGLLMMPLSLSGIDRTMISGGFL